MSGLPRSEKYYLNDHLVVLAVDNQLYRVHKRVLVQESEVFASMFELPQRPTLPETAEGSSDDHPIVVPVTSRAEFEAFLDYLYSRPGETYRTDLPTWLLLYVMGDRYSCENLVRKAVREIEDFTKDYTYIDRIVLADRYGLQQLLLKAIRDFTLARARIDLGYPETSRLGLGRTTMLFRISERIYRLRRTLSWEEDIEALITEEMALYDEHMHGQAGDSCDTEFDLSSRGNA